MVQSYMGMKFDEISGKRFGLLCENSTKSLSQMQFMYKQRITFKYKEITILSFECR